MSDSNEKRGIWLDEHGSFEDKWIACNRRPGGPSESSFVYDPIGAANDSDLKAVQLHISADQAHHSTPNTSSNVAEKLNTDDIVVGACTNCQRAGGLMCSRCSSFYCSPICQMANWHTHRYHCVPISSYFKLKCRSDLLSINASDVSQTPDSTESPSVVGPETTSPAVITYVLNEQVIFVRPTTDEAIASYAKTIQDVWEYSKEATPIEGRLNMKQIVLVFYKNTFYRAMVLSVYDAGSVVVARIDIGDVIQVPSSKLFELSGELKDRSAHVQRIVLKGVSHGPWYWKQIEHLLNLLDTATELTLKHVDTTAFDLYEKDSGIWVNEVLLAIGGGHNMPGGCTSVDVEAGNSTEEVIQFERVCGSNIKMIVLDNSMMLSGVVSCIQVCDIDGRSAMHDAIDAYCGESSWSPTATADSPRLHEVCLAYCQIQCRWLRAVCVDEPNLIVHFLDRGDVKRVESEHIRPLPAEFAQYPCSTVFCFIEGLHDAMHIEGKDTHLRKRLDINKQIVFATVEYEENQICRCILAGLCI